MDDRPPRTPVNGILLDLPDSVWIELAPAARLAAVGRLTGSAAHALGNSLFAVLGLVELLLADADRDSPEAERLALVQATALELRDTLRTLVAAARPARDDPGPAMLDDAVRTAVRTLRRTSAAVRLELVERYPEQPLAVAADAATLEQIVVQLLVEAWEAAGSDGTVELAVTADGGAAVLRIHADGDGDGGPGASLGLLVAGALARAEGGSLDAAARGDALLRLPRA